ncbi:MAG TPA: discoidin domain-containing protein, partial [Bacteroidia bacterium]|nr:discoidin domain-containing protein [Bacteroidia bacterium]
SSIYPGYSYYIIKDVALDRMISRDSYFTFDEINDGGELLFDLAGGKDEAAHFEIDKNHDSAFLTAPIISNTSGRTFTKELKIELTTNHTNAFIFYKLNNDNWKQYSSPILINDHAQISAYAISSLTTNSVTISDTSFAEFFKVPDYNSITIANPFAPQYAAGGNRALIDGIRGADNFRTGDWQGYEGKDLDAVIDLGSVKDITHIATGFLQDQNAWIFFPSEVIFYSSMDGKTFTEIEANKNTFRQDSQTVLLHDFYTDKKIKTRYIKVVAKNSGPCPAWHPGKGNPSWIFADEIVIK